MVLKAPLNNKFPSNRHLATRMLVKRFPSGEKQKQRVETVGTWKELCNFTVDTFREMTSEMIVGKCSENLSFVRSQITFQKAHVRTPSVALLQLVDVYWFLVFTTLEAPLECLHRIFWKAYLFDCASDHKCDSFWLLLHEKFKTFDQAIQKKCAFLTNIVSATLSD